MPVINNVIYNTNSQSAEVQEFSSKSRLVAVLLCLFLGGLGAHNFYLGYTQKGIIQLTLCVFGWLTSAVAIGILLVLAVSFWVILDLLRLILSSGKYRFDGYGDLL